MAGLRRHLGAFVVCICGGAFLAGSISLFLTPVYVASSRLLVEDQSAAGGLLAAAAELPGGLGSLVGGAPQTAAETEMLKSRPVATSVVLPAGADDVAPDVGQNLLVLVDDLTVQSLWEAAWRKLSGDPEPPGTLAVEVRRWEFSEDFDDSLLMRFADEGQVEISIDRFFDKRTVETAFRSGEELEFESATLVLRPDREAVGHLAGRSFRVTIGALQKTVEDFLEDLEVKEPQRGSNVLRVAYPDSNSERSAAIVNAVVASYMAHNQRRIGMRAGRPVRFLEVEIERLREELGLAENELASFGAEAGPIVLPDSAGQLVERLAEIDLERARLELSATATMEFVERYDAGDLSLRELAGLEGVILAETPPVEPLSALIAEMRGLEALYNVDWPELIEATAVVDERVAALRTLLASRVQSEQRLSADLDQIQQRYMGELDGMPEAQVELLRYTRKVEAFSQIYLFLVGQLQEAKIRAATAVPAVDVIERAVPPRKRSRPKLAINLALGAILGLVMGVLWAFTREMRRPLSTEEQTAHAAGVPALGSIPHGRRLRSVPLAVRDDPAGGAARGFQALRGGLKHTALQHQARRIVIASEGPSEGRSLVAANLAISLSRTGERVLLVDADDIRPVQSTWFGKAGSDLAAALGGDESEIQPISKGLHLVGGNGAIDAEVADWTAGVEGARDWDALAARADWVIIDTAPLSMSALATALSTWADGVLLVGRRGATPEAELTRAAGRLVRTGARPLGSVLTDV